MLVGVFLAVIAFVGVILLSQQGPAVDPNQPPTTANVVVARENIALGTVIQESMIEVKTVEIAGAETDAFADISQVVGQTARAEVVAGGQITARTLGGGAGTPLVNIDVPDGYRAMSVLVDQVTGVGTLIKTGDYVDAVVRFEIQPTQENEDTGAFEPVQGVDTTSTKLLIQGIQVIGVVLPPVAAPAEGEAPAQGAVLNNQQELVILAVTPAQAEVLKYVEDTAGQTVSLVLRSPADFLDENGNPRLPESPCITAPLPTPTPVASGEPTPSETPAPYRGCETTEGIVLNSLIFDYGVLVPPVTGGPVPVIPTPAPTAEPTEEPETSPAP
jgi:pilus assembly protein CpaB